ncbi:GntR family transcriptional regulator [Alphaproteobacteria bacterium KMM 3653]|uniref:GntR family transcriptional regulator n=2 Tax=Harenicola maris TaxID=2841044 RepID=A0AAP2CPF4_9RHOB|nr:GntR family transcriptional regulator [Harenicola maris]
MKQSGPVMDIETLPKYAQVRDLLIREILSGHLLDGERLPPERDMAAKLGVAVGTLRKGLRSLEKRGLLERVQGSGNYIRTNEEVSGIYAFFRLELAKGGGLPTARVLSVEAAQMPADLPDLPGGNWAHRIRRMRMLDMVPIAMEEIWLSRNHAETVTAGDLSDSLYQFYKTRLNLWITRAEDRVSLSKMPQWTEGLRLNAGDTCGFIERVSYAQTGAPAETSRTWFDPEVAHYVQNFK